MMATVRLTGDPQKIFTSAVWFHVAASVLNQDTIRRASDDQAAGKTTGHKFPCIFPSVVCGSFSLELYFKCLLVIDSGSFPRIHQLAVLFAELQTNRQDRIKAIFLDEMKPPEYAHALGQLNIPIDVDDVLAKADEAFETYRYPYEGIDRDCDFRGVFLQMAAMRAILEINPDWQEIVDCLGVRFSNVLVSTADGNVTVVTVVDP